MLDDYHVIEDPAIHRALIFLLEHLPAQMHLVIATRADPPLPLARLRGRGQLCEVRVADLRFATEEVEAFLHGMMHLDLAPDEVSILKERHPQRSQPLLDPLSERELEVLQLIAAGASNEEIAEQLVIAVAPSSGM